jgi:hypothetical protein
MAHVLLALCFYFLKAVGEVRQALMMAQVGQSGDMEAQEVVRA